MQKGWFADVGIMSKRIFFKINTGAEANIMSYRTFRKIGFAEQQLKHVAISLIGFNQSRAKPLGSIKLPCQVDGKTYNIKFFVMEESPDLLGIETERRLQRC